VSGWGNGISSALHPRRSIVSHPVRFTPADVPDQTGRTAVVTGASSGLGELLAEHLAAAGATVVMAVRNPAKGRGVEESIRRRHPDARLEVAELDLADLSSVRRFAASLNHRRVDLLLNNAGIGNIERRLTPQGHETQVATNHLGPALLARLLVPNLALGQDPRIVTTGSNIYTRLPVRIDLTDLDSERRYSRSAVYARTKTLHMVWAAEHQRRLVAANAGIRSLVAHPGMVTTPMNTGLTARRDRVVASVLGRIWGAREPEQGLRPLLYAATSPEASPHQFAGPTGPKDDALVTLDAFRTPVTDLSLAGRVWDVTARLVGEKSPARTTGRRPGSSLRAPS
jgi:NAD(P)-dependent dehydrogenase (short-subunit alcohol dehydrogenase family)